MSDNNIILQLTLALATLTKEDDQKNEQIAKLTELLDAANFRIARLEAELVGTEGY